jgi:hypothetical protein
MVVLQSFRGSLATAAFLLACLLFAGACEDDTTAPQAVEPTVNVTLTVTEIQVIAECEGTTGTNPGDFVFEVHFYTSDADIATQQFSGSFTGLNGQTVDIPDIVFELNRLPPEDGQLYLEFRVTELDNGVPDSGMNDARAILDFGWPTSDTSEEFYAATVSGSSRCSVLFVNTLSAVRN